MPLLAATLLILDGCGASGDTEPPVPTYRAVGTITNVAVIPASVYRGSLSQGDRKAAAAVLCSDVFDAAATSAWVAQDVSSLSVEIDERYSQFSGMHIVMRGRVDGTEVTIALDFVAAPDSLWGACITEIEVSPAVHRDVFAPVVD